MERDIERASIVKKAARIHRVSIRYVRMVITGERVNEEIMKTYMEIQEQTLEVENRLLQEVNKLVPFN